MIKSESCAQVDNTLLMSIGGLFAHGLTNPIADVTNLMTFAQAVILFDKVTIPIWDAKVLATRRIPATIAPRNIFKDALDKSFQTRWEGSIKQSLMMCGLSNEVSIISEQSLNSVISLSQSILSSEGQAWPVAFENHIQQIENTQSENNVRDIKQRMDSYANVNAYLSLPIKEKAALTYLWRCLYNVSFSIEKNRPYLHNVYRLPFVNAIFRYLEKQNIPAPWSEKATFDTATASYQPSIGKVLLPSLLGAIISSVDKKEQIIPKMLEMRDSKPARDFRTHYSGLQEKLGEPGAAVKTEKDIQYLIDLWSGISDPITIPTSLSIHNVRIPDWHLGLDIIIPKSVVVQAKRLNVRLRHRQLRFATYLIDHQADSMELSNLMIKRFNPISKRGSSQYINVRKRTEL